MSEIYDCLDGFCGALDCVRCHPECVEEPDPDEWMGPYDEEDDDE